MVTEKITEIRVLVFQRVAARGFLREIWGLLALGSFVGGGGVHVSQQVAQVIQALNQALFAVGVDVKIKLLTIGQGDSLRGQVDEDARFRGFLCQRQQHVHRGFGQGDGQQAIFEGVVVENIGKRGTNDRTEAVVGQGPNRMLTAGAAAKILARDEDLRIRVVGLIQHEIRVGAAVRQIAPSREQARAHARFGDGGQKSGGNNLIGVHIFRPQRDGSGIEDCKWVHKNDFSVGGQSWGWLKSVVFGGKMILSSLGGSKMETKVVNDSSTTVSLELYQRLAERVDRLEQLIQKLIQMAEDKEDIRVMREAEIEYRTGDAVAFDELIAEILSEKE